MMFTFMLGSSYMYVTLGDSFFIPLFFPFHLAPSISRSHFPILIIIIIITLVHIMTHNVYIHGDIRDK